jgi:tetratricopeptide (TPR) repeat protein
VEYRPKSNEEYQRILKEADFAFRQAFAFCPYSPEAVFRYVQLLMQTRRFDDALLLAQTCLKLDPYNGQVRGLVETIKTWKQQAGGADQARNSLVQLEDEVRKNPTDVQAAFNLAMSYLQLQQTDRAIQVLDGVLNSPQADASAFRGLIQAYSSFGNTAGLQKVAEKLEALVRTNPGNSQATIGLVEAYRQLQKPEAAMPLLDKLFDDPKLDGNTALSIAQAYAALGNAPKLEATLQKLTKLMPSNPEAWYDLAVVESGLGKPTEAMSALRQAMDLNAKRPQQDPKASNLVANARKEEHFAPLRQLPEFKKLVPP